MISHVARPWYDASDGAISVVINAVPVQASVTQKNRGLQRRASAAVRALGKGLTGAAASSEGDIGMCEVSSPSATGKGSASAARLENRGRTWRSQNGPIPDLGRGAWEQRAARICGRSGARKGWACGSVCSSVLCDLTVVSVTSESRWSADQPKPPDPARGLLLPAS